LQGGTANRLLDSQLGQPEFMEDTTIVNSFYKPTDITTEGTHLAEKVAHQTAKKSSERQKLLLSKSGELAQNF